MRVLVAEDDLLGGVLLERAVARAGHHVELARDGSEALSRAEAGPPFDAVLVDLIMPGLDGLELMSALRRRLSPTPILIVTTAQTTSESRARALEAGADDYITKPYDVQRVIEVLESCFQRRHQVFAPAQPMRPAAPAGSPADFSCLAIGAGSGGPSALRTLLGRIDASQAAVLIVQQAPDYILDTLVKMLGGATLLPVCLAQHGMPLRPASIYVAPAGRHMTVRSDLTVALKDDPPENYLRPSADPLFRSAARAFRERCLAVVLSGMGCDGSQGAAEVHACGGRLLAQDPSEAVTPSMPASLLKLGVGAMAQPLQELAQTINRHILKSA